MRFSLKQTSARAFDFSLPDPEGRARQLGFEHITDLGGAIEIDPRAILLQEAAARLLQITAVEWRTESGLITVGAPVAIADLFVDGCIPRGHQESPPLHGRVTVKRLSTERLLLEGFGPRISTGLRLERVEVAQREPAGTAAVETVALSELETTLGGFLVRLSEAVAGGIHAQWPVAGNAEPEPAGGMALTVASVTGANLAMRSRAVDIQVENIDVRDAAMRGRAFSVAAASVGKLSLELDLAALRSGARDAGRADDPDAADCAPERPSIRSLIDWRFLDRVDGQLDVDVTVDAHLPVIRRRRATHYFRVPIEKGIFNYRQLESGLSSLENAVIDFDVRGHKLVIERDLPIIRMRKNLVEWHLDDEEMVLARQRKVKLRTLPRFEIAPGNGKSSDVKLHGIEIHPINIDLSVAPPPVHEPDAGTDAAARPAQAASAQEYGGILPELVLRRLIATGSLDYPDSEGALTIKVKQLAAALRGVPLGDFVVDVGAIRVESIVPIKIVFDGLLPRSISLTLHGLELERVTVTPAAESAGAATPVAKSAGAVTSAAESATAPDAARPADVAASERAPTGDDQ